MTEPKHYYMDHPAYESIRKRLEGYGWVAGVAIANKDLIYILFEWTGRGKHAGSVKLTRYDHTAEDPWQEVHISHYADHKLVIDPVREELVVSGSNDGWRVNGTHHLVYPVTADLTRLTYPEREHERDGALLMNFRFRNFKVIAGTLYAVGNGGAVAIRRTPDGNWHSLGLEGLPLIEPRPDLDHPRVSIGAKSIDGFAHDNLYICGKQGHLWHYNGRRWRRIDIPTLDDLAAVCCIDKGVMFVLSEKGGVWIGDGDRWSALPQLPTWEVKSATVFDQKLWVGAKLGTYILDLQHPDPFEYISLSAMPGGADVISQSENELILGAGGKIVVYDGEFEQFMGW